jgi:putative ABC transport system permease protein
LKPLILAWGWLSHSPARLVSAVSAILFAVMLMLIQVGFYSSIFDSATEFYRTIDGEVFIVRKDKATLLQTAPFERTRAYQARSVDGVSGTATVIIDRRFTKNFEDGFFRPIRVIAVRPEEAIFRDPRLNKKVALLARPGTALIDTYSRDYFGNVGPGPGQMGRWGYEIIGTFDLGTAFDADGNLLMSQTTWSQATRRRTAQVELISVKLEPSADPKRVVAELSAHLPDDVLVLDREGMIAHESAFWAHTAPVTPVFGVGLLVGFLVGIVICYQILYTDVHDHWGEISTLRAIGFTDGFIKAIVVSEALLLSLIAALPGVLLGFVVYEVMESVVGLKLRMTLGRVAFVTGLSVVMCLISSQFALRRALEADPAELF